MISEQAAPVQQRPLHEPAGYAARLLDALRRTSPAVAAPAVILAALLVAVYWPALTSLVRHWWTAEGGGILLAPLACLLALRRGVRPGARAQPRLGFVLLCGSLLAALLAEAAATLFLLQLSLLGAVTGLIIASFGLGQLRHWWLACVLLLLAIPLPSVLEAPLHAGLQSIAAPLAAGIFELRGMSAQVIDNVIHLPAGFSVVVEQGCSGLGALTTTTAVALLATDEWLRSPIARIATLLLAAAAAIVFNAVRVFLIGYLVYFVGDVFREGLAHEALGWITFTLTMASLALVTAVVAWLEQRRAGA